MERDSTPGTARKVDRMRSTLRPDPNNGSRTALVQGREMLGKSVGTIFRVAREAQALSQDQVAAMTAGPLGPVSRTTISSIERGRMPNVESLVSLSDALYVDPTAVLDHVRVATQVPTDIAGLSYDAARERGLALFWAGDYRKALAVYDAMLEQLKLDPPSDGTEADYRRARIEINRASALRRCGALSAARTAAERAVTMTGGFPDLQVKAYVVLAALLIQAGLEPFARDAANNAVAVGEGQESLGLAWIVKGEVAYAQAQFEDALAAFLRARDLVRNAEDFKHVMHVEGNIGVCLFAMGKRSHARKRIVDAVELARKHGVPFVEASWLVELGRVSLEGRNIDEAEACALAALRIARPHEQLLTIFRAEWLLHQIVRARQPDAPDRHRLAYLRKLYGAVRRHRGIDTIREFETTILGVLGDPDRSPR